MATLNGNFFDKSYHGRSRKFTLNGRVTTTTSGTIGSQTAQKISRFVVVRTATGTYSVTFNERFRELLHFDVKVIGANATYTAAKGFQAFVVTDQVNHANKKIIFSLLGANGGAIADVEDSGILLITVVVTKSATL